MPNANSNGQSHAGGHRDWLTQINGFWLIQSARSGRFRRYPLLWSAAALLAGGKLGAMQLPFGDLPQSACAFIALCLVLISIFALLGRRRVTAGLSAISAIFVLGVWFGAESLAPASDSLSELATRKSEPIAARLVIESAAVWSPNPNHRAADPGSEAWRTMWQVRVESVRDRQSWRDVQACSTLSVDGRVDSFLPGDVVEVYGSFRAIYDPTNPGAFDLAEHAGKQGRFVFLSADDASQLSRIGGRDGYFWSRLRAKAVQQIDRTLYRNVGFQQAPLAAALVFGQREQVDWEDQQELMATGTLHMLAISGMHVEIVAWGVLLICMALTSNDKIRFVSLVCICALYAGLADGKPPVMRAVVLVAAFELSRCLGRRGRLGNLLGFAAIILFLLNATNVDNVGVHLSFLAVATIGVFVLDGDPSASSKKSALQNVIQESLGARGRLTMLASQWLLGMFKLSFWVWLITCPLIWTNFHVVAPIAIPLNILIALPLAVSLLSGIMTGVLGWLAPVGWFAGITCGVGLATVSKLVEIGKAVPGGHMWLPAPPVWWTFVFYAAVVIWLLAFQNRWRLWLAGLLVGWLVFGVGLFALGPRGFWLQSDDSHASEQRRDLLVTFLDVGHGTCVVIEMPDGSVWLYDAGHLGASERSHQEIAAALWSIGTARIDTLILSHADADHYNAAKGLIERFSVGRVASTEQFWNSADRDVQLLADVIEDRGVPTATLAAGDEGTVGELKWKVLHPSAGTTAESDNASSLCLLMQFRGKQVLLPGDLEGSGLTNLVALPERPCHVLMAPHHGSLSLDPTNLLEWCRPDLIVISGNHRANRKEVISKYAAAASEMGITFRDGAIQYRVSDSGEATVWHWKKDSWASTMNSND